MLFLGLLFVGFAFIIVSLNMMGKISARATIPMAISTTALLLSAVVRVMWFTPDATMADFSQAATICLFGFTYVYLAATNIFNLDPRGNQALGARAQSRPGVPRRETGLA